jgi:hypothetical protein
MKFCRFSRPKDFSKFRRHLSGDFIKDLSSFRQDFSRFCQDFSHKFKRLKSWDIGWDFKELHKECR